MRKIIILFIVLTGCQDYELFPEQHIPQELEAYVDEFVEGAKAHDRKLGKIKERLDIKIVPDLETPGYCETHGRQVIISIREEYYLVVLKYPKRLRSLIFHEMGHGFLHRSHIDTPIRTASQGGYLQSIMRSTVHQTDFTDEQWAFMVDELF